MKIFLKKHWLKIAAALAALPFAGYLILCLFIGIGVRSAVSDAQGKYPGEPVAALISVATSEESQLSERNRAIWALGQLGAGQALPTLQAMVSGEGCDHETRICQHELEKAIEGCSGGINIGAVVWRHGELAVASKE